MKEDQRKAEEERKKRRRRSTRGLFPERNIDLIAFFLLRLPFLSPLQSLSDKGRREDGAREKERGSERQIREGRRAY